jgi:hypothetical protein
MNHLTAFQAALDDAVSGADPRLVSDAAAGVQWAVEELTAEVVARLDVYKQLEGADDGEG